MNLYLWNTGVFSPIFLLRKPSTRPAWWHKITKVTMRKIKLLPVGLYDTIASGLFVTVTLCLCLFGDFECENTDPPYTGKLTPFIVLALCWLFQSYSLLVKPKSKCLDFTCPSLMLHWQKHCPYRSPVLGQHPLLAGLSSGEVSGSILRPSPHLYTWHHVYYLKH